MNTFGLSDKRYEQMKAYGNSDVTIGELIRLYGHMTVEDGYFVCKTHGTSTTIRNAMVVETTPQLGAFSSNWDACREAEKHGTEFINDMPGLEKGYYVDTPANRQLCENALLRNPDLRIDNWIDIEDGEWGTRYAEHFGAPALPELASNQEVILRTELPDRIEVGCYTDQVMPAGTPDWMLDNFWCGLLVLKRDWAEERAKSIGYADLEEFLGEYTWDDTLGWFQDAIEDGALLGFSTGEMPYTERKMYYGEHNLAPAKQPSLDEQMSRAKETAERANPTPTQAPDRERS